MTNLPAMARLVWCEHLIRLVLRLALPFLSSSFSSFSRSSFSVPFSFSHFSTWMDFVLWEMLLVSPDHFCSRAFSSFYSLLWPSSFWVSDCQALSILSDSSLRCSAFLKDFVLKDHLLAGQGDLVPGQLKVAALDLWSLLHHTLKHI